MEQKIIRDPIYDYVAIDKGRDGWLLKLLGAKEMQRLRYVTQLGVSQFTYPGATHTRFSHALGVLHLMQIAWRHLEDFVREFIPDGDERELTRKALFASALLHDVGHGPFSHALDGMFGPKHERRSNAVVTDSGTDVGQLLRSIDGLLPGKVAAIIGRDATQAELWQISLLSSQLDVDRIDYLMRDSYFSGAEYGHFDWYRIIHTMVIVEHPTLKKPCIVWPVKTGYALEEYIFSRFYMYQAVYFHHCSRGFEKLLIAILKLAKRQSRTADVPEPLATFLRGEELSLDAYLRLTEFQILGQMERWQASLSDDLGDLCRRFLSRTGFSHIDIKPEQTGKLLFEGKDRSAEDYLVKADVDPEAYLLKDHGTFGVYDAYHAEKENAPGDPFESILLQLSTGGLKEISDELPRLKAITGTKSGHFRYYCPAEHKEAVVRILLS